MSRPYVNTHQATHNRQRHSSMRSVENADNALRKRRLLDDEEAIGTCCFIPLSMWKADVGMKGVVHPEYSFEGTKRHNSNRKVLLIEADGVLLARVDSRSSSYEMLTGEVGYPCENAYVEWIQGWSEKGSMMFVPYSVHGGRKINPKKEESNPED